MTKPRELSDEEEDERSALEERAAIMEYDGGLPRRDAEREARKRQPLRRAAEAAARWLEGWTR